jgi:hypothetical protein
MSVRVEQCGPSSFRIHYSGRKPGVAQQCAAEGIGYRVQFVRFLVPGRWPRCLTASSTWSSNGALAATTASRILASEGFDRVAQAAVAQQHAASYGEYFTESCRLLWTKDRHRVSPSGCLAGRVA